MRMMAMFLLALALSQACLAGDEAQISEKSRKKWGVELAIDSLEIKNPLITKDLVRAIYWHESEWQQLSPDGKAYSCRERARVASAAMRHLRQVTPATTLVTTSS